MLKRFKSMLGFTRKLERPNPDAISASLVIASQRNERASDNAKKVLIELLEANDQLRAR